MRAPRNQLQGNSPIFDISSELELTLQSLNKREFVLKVIFAAVVFVDAPESLLINDSIAADLLRLGLSFIITF